VEKEGEKKANQPWVFCHIRRGLIRLVPTTTQPSIWKRLYCLDLTGVRYFTKSLYCTFSMVVLCPLLLGKKRGRGATFVQFWDRGEKLAFFYFIFCVSFLKEHCFKENCIMHSSICTNGYFLSYYIDIHARNAAGETTLTVLLFVLLSQSDTT